MTNAYRVLVLSDHRNHSDQNSIYAILREMITHKHCTSIHVASRGINQNDSFFIAQNASELFASQVDRDFQYEANGKYFKQNLEKVDINAFNLVFLRLPRPITDDFLMWLQKIFANVPIINSPKGIIETSSKAFLINFEKECPHIKLCKTKEEVESFNKLHDKIVLKPLREYGGKGIVKISGQLVDDGQKIIPLKEYLALISDELEKEGFLAMKYLKNVTQGDKRILVAGGKILAASLRLPPENSWICNVAQGGKSVLSEVTNEEIKIIKAITPKLLERGIVIFGADTLVDDNGSRVLSEINTLSIGGFPQAQAQTGKPIIKQLLNKIFSYANDFK